MPRDGSPEEIDIPRRGVRRAAIAALAALLCLAVAVVAALAWSRTTAGALWSAGRAIDRGDPGAAFDRLRPLLPGDDPRVVSLAARALIADGRPMLAARMLAARLERRADPQWSGLLGDASLAIGDLARARESYRDFLASNPDDADRLARYAGLCYELAGPAEALPVYDRLIALEPDRPGHHADRGRLLLEIDRYEQAAESFQAALDLADDPEYRFLLAECQFLLGRLDACLENLEVCLAAGPDDRVAMARAECLRALGRTVEAAGALDEVLGRSPDHPRALRLRAELLLEAGDDARAEQLLRRAEQRSPDDWQIQYQRSIALARLGRAAEARELAERSRANQALDGERHSP